MNWRRIKRILFWPNSVKDKEKIINERRERLQLYKRAIYIKDALCTQAKLDETFYRTFKEEEIYSEILDDGYRMGCLFHALEENYDIYYSFWCKHNKGNGFPLLNDLFFKWKNAPFWKDYESWKKIQELNNDFKM